MSNNTFDFYKDKPTKNTNDHILSLISLAKIKKTIAINNNVINNNDHKKQHSKKINFDNILWKELF